MCNQTLSEVLKIQNYAFQLNYPAMVSGHYFKTFYAVLNHGEFDFDNDSFCILKLL